jgi:hypothetical protein
VRLRRPTREEQERADRDKVRKRCGGGGGVHHWLQNGVCEICGSRRPPQMREADVPVNELGRGSEKQRHEAQQQMQKHRAKVAKWAERRGLGKHLK